MARKPKTLFPPTKIHPCTTVKQIVLLLMHHTSGILRWSAPLGQALPPAIMPDLYQNKGVFFRAKLRPVNCRKRRSLKCYASKIKTLQNLLNIPQNSTFQPSGNRAIPDNFPQKSRQKPIKTKPGKVFPCFEICGYLLLLIRLQVVFLD